MVFCQFQPGTAFGKIRKVRTADYAVFYTCLFCQPQHPLQGVRIKLLSFPKKS